MILGQKISVQLIGDAGLSILGFITTILIAKFLGSQILGAVGLVLGTLGLFGSLLDLGFGTAHTKKIAEGGRVSEKISTYFLISFVLAIVYTLVLLIYFLARLQTGETFAGISLIVFLIFYFYQITQSFSQVFLTTLTGLGEAVKYNLVWFLAVFLRTILIGIVVFAGLSLTFLSFSYLTGGLFLLILAFLLVGKFRLVKPSKSLFKSYLTFTFPMMVTTVVSYIFGNIDRVILGAFWDLKTVGIFFGIFSITQFPQQISSSAMTFFFPEMSKIFAKKDLTQLKKKTFLVVKYLLLIVTPILVLLTIFRTQFIEFFLGKEFLGGTSIFLIFLVLAFLATIVRPYGNVLIAAGLHKILPIVSIFNLFLLIFLELVLIPKEFLGIKMVGLGVTGAALANLAIWIVTGAVQIFWVAKFLKIGLPKSILIQILAGALFYFLATFFASYIGEISGLIIGAILGLIAYFLVLIILKELQKDDLSYLFKIVKFK